VQFKSKHGTFQPRQAEDLQLYRWVYQQVQLFHGGKLEQARKDKLDAIGFEDSIPKDQDTRWDQMLDKVVQYKSKHGTFLLHLAEDPQLYRWVYQQQNLFHNGKLKHARKDKLVAIGFDNSIALELVQKQSKDYDICWYQMLDKLVQYTSKHGTCFPGPTADPQLYKWLWRQRKLFHGGKLKQARRDILGAIGLDWREQASNE
jgi:Helicase associated domain